MTLGSNIRADCRVSAYFVSWTRICFHNVDFLLQFFVRLLHDFRILYTDVQIFLACKSWRLKNLGLSRTLIATQVISPIHTHFSVAWSLCLSTLSSVICHIRTSCLNLFKSSRRCVDISLPVSASVRSLCLNRTRLALVPRFRNFHLQSRVIS